MKQVFEDAAHPAVAVEHAELDHGLRRQTVWVLTLALLLPASMTLSKFPKFSLSLVKWE